MTKHPVEAALELALERHNKAEWKAGDAAILHNALPLVRKLVKDREALEYILQHGEHTPFKDGNKVYIRISLDEKDCPPHLRERLEKMK